MEVRIVPTGSPYRHGEPRVAVITVTEAGDTSGHIDLDTLRAVVDGLPGEVTAVVLVREGEASAHLLGPARSGVVAVTAVRGIDAVKQVADGYVVATLDRDRVALARLPMAMPRTVITEALTGRPARPAEPGAMAAHGRHGRLSALLGGVPADEIVLLPPPVGDATATGT